MELTIGTVIADLRRKKGMTQEQLAEAVGVSAPAVSKWETNSSCPDVTLLAPIARALGTDVNGLLSFHPAMTKEELQAFIFQNQQLAITDGKAALGKMEELVHQYPNDPELWFQLASMAMALPPLGGLTGEDAAAANAFAVRGLEYARAYGERRLWPTATYLLASIRLEAGELDEAEALLDSLPVMSHLSQILYVALYKKRGDVEKARLTARSQLMMAGQMVLSSLSILSSTEYADTPEEAERACEAYEGVVKALGYPHAIGEIVRVNRALETGEMDAAAEQFLQLAKNLAGDFAPTPVCFSSIGHEEYGAYRRNLGRILRNSMKTDPQFAPLREMPQFAEALEILNNME